MVKKVFFFALLFFTVNPNYLCQHVLLWEVQHPINKQWFPLGERGSVQEALITNGLLPDPFYGENEKLFQWIEDHQWKMRSRFFLTEEMFSAKDVEIDFPCIDTYASIYVNNQKILDAENYFHPYQVEIRSQLHLGYNEIEAVFTPPVLYHKTYYENQSFHYPAPNDNASIKAAPLTRKPQYQFGWDWAPRLNTLGFPYPVSVQVKKPKYIKSLVVNTLSINEAAKMQWLIEKTDKNKSHSFHSKYFGWTVKNDTSSLLNFEFHIKDPQLWWPKGMGKAYVYEDTLLFINERGEIIESRPYSFGIRTVKLNQTKDKWGTPFSFEINGNATFMKGGDMIPPSMFGGETTKKEWEDWVQVMVDCHFNMVRIWGGGDYATEAFLEACDREGLMVWHDAMFACAMYPGDSSFLSNVKNELEFQIPRIVKHPSVVYINGNNEVDVAWKNWGFQLQYNLGKDDQTTIEAAYEALFKNLLPLTVKRFSNLPYVHTSPLSNWGKTDYYNHGTQHYWGVWHGADPLSDFALKIGRFNAEFGFQSFPEYATLSTFSNLKDWDLNSKIMTHHQKSYVGNRMILKHAKELYGTPKNFEDFAYFSQLTQAKAVCSAIGGHILDAPRCMGTLYWQINDCWPAPTWSSIDYTGQWKALHYGVKKIFNDISLIQNNDTEYENIFVTVSNSNGLDIFAELIITDLSDHNKNSKKEIELVRVTLKNFEKQLIHHSQLGGPPKLIEVSLSDDLKQSFIVGDYPGNPNVKYSLAVKELDSIQRKGVLVLENDQFMADVWLYSNVTGVHFEVNFEHFLPGTHEIPFTFLENAGTIKLKYR